MKYLPRFAMRLMNLSNRRISKDLKKILQRCIGNDLYRISRRKKVYIIGLSTDPRQSSIFVVRETLYSVGVSSSSLDIWRAWRILLNAFGIPQASDEDKTARMTLVVRDLSDNMLICLVAYFYFDRADFILKTSPFLLGTLLPTLVWDFLCLVSRCLFLSFRS